MEAKIVGERRKSGFRKPQADTMQPAKRLVALARTHDEKVQRVLDSCPVAGMGVNPWLFGAAKRLYGLGLEAERVEELLEEATLDCGRELPGEIELAVRNAHPDAARASSSARRWPEKN